MREPDDLTWVRRGCVGPDQWAHRATPPVARPFLAFVVDVIQVASSFGALRGQPDRWPLDALTVVLLLVAPPSHHRGTMATSH